MIFQQFAISITHAWSGIKFAYSHERNIQIQFLAAPIVFLMCIIFRLRQVEWAIIITAITAVIVLELLNTAIEYLIDALRPRFHLQVKVVKDIMAGVVLCASGGAALVGLLVFGPHTYRLLFF
jgi:diacylglycerol kinase